MCPKGAYGTRLKRPMAEDPSPRDKWYLANGVVAFTFPLLDEVQDAPQRLFGQEAEFQERYADEEVQGGKIALIALKQMRAQKPPFLSKSLTISEFLKPRDKSRESIVMFPTFWKT
jgi:hypothetical protein